MNRRGSSVPSESRISRISFALFTSTRSLGRSLVSCRRIGKMEWLIFRVGLAVALRASQKARKDPAGGVS